MSQLRYHRVVRSVLLHPRARETIRAFPRRAGVTREQLAQPGMGREAASPAREDGRFRVFYFTASADGILVIHAFQKKKEQPPRTEIETARKRLKELIDG